MPTIGHLHIIEKGSATAVLLAVCSTGTCYSTRQARLPERFSLTWLGPTGKVHVRRSSKTILMKRVQAHQNEPEWKIFSFLNLTLPHCIRIVSNLFHSQNTTSEQRFATKYFRSEISDLVKILKKWLFQLVFRRNRRKSKLKHTKLQEDFF